MYAYNCMANGRDLLNSVLLGDCSVFPLSRHRLAARERGEKERGGRAREEQRGHTSNTVKETRSAHQRLLSFSTCSSGDGESETSYSCSSPETGYSRASSRGASESTRSFSCDKMTLIRAQAAIIVNDVQKNALDSNVSTSQHQGPFLTRRMRVANHHVQHHNESLTSVVISPGDDDSGTLREGRANKGAFSGMQHIHTQTCT